MRYWGEGVAAVAATSEEIAEEALDLIEIEYERCPAALTVEEALCPGAPMIHETASGRQYGDRAGCHHRAAISIAALRKPIMIIEGEYEMGRPTPAYMEPNICVCQWDATGKLTTWISTQTAFMVRGILAEVLGLPLHKVRVLVDHMGGGFGAKQDLFQNEFLCALLAKQPSGRCEWSQPQRNVSQRTFAASRQHLAQAGLQEGWNDHSAAGAHDFQ